MGGNGSGGGEEVEEEFLPIEEFLFKEAGEAIEERGVEVATTPLETTPKEAEVAPS